MSDSEEGSIPTLTLPSAKKSRFWVIETGDFQTDEELAELIGRMYDYPEDAFYLFCAEGSAKDPPVQAALDGHVLLAKEWQHGYFPHPMFQRDYVRLRKDSLSWDWERNLMASGQPFVRFELVLSAAARRALEHQQLVALHQAANSNPLELKPNFMGLGIDLMKAIDWLRAALKRGSR